MVICYIFFMLYMYYIREIMYQQSKYINIEFQGFCRQELQVSFVFENCIVYNKVVGNVQFSFYKQNIMFLEIDVFRNQVFFKFLGDFDGVVNLKQYLRYI